MKFLFSFLVVLFSTIFLFAQNFPKAPNTLVNDYASILSSNEKRLLENKLVAYNDSTSTQIAIAIVEDLQGYDRADFAVNLAKYWGIGGQKNNGALILLSKQERKLYIATGYGLEAKLTDALTKRIQTKYMVPYFKSGNYAQGLNNGIDEIIKVLNGEYKSEPVNKENSIFTTLFFIILVLVIIYLISRNSNGGGGMRNRGLLDNPAMPFIGWGNIGRGGSFFGDSGFGGNSGGFGGFGGGDFGGGGAGSDW